MLRRIHKVFLTKDNSGAVILKETELSSGGSWMGMSGGRAQL